MKADTEGEQRIAGSYQVRCAVSWNGKRKGMRSHPTGGGTPRLCTWAPRSAGLCAEAPCSLALQGLYAKMVEAFKKMGLEVVPGVGTPFDPEVGPIHLLSTRVCCRALTDKQSS